MAGALRHTEAGSPTRSVTAAPDTLPAGYSAALLNAVEASALPGWHELARNAAEDNSVLHPDFLLPAMRNFGHGVRVAAIHDAGDRLVALAPLVGRRLGRIAPALSVWVHDYGPLGTPLVAADAVGPAVDALVSAMAGWVRGALLFPMLTAGQVANRIRARAAALGRPVAVLDAHARAMLDRSADGTDPRAALATKKRKEFARQMRRLADLGPVAIETARGNDVAPRLEEFLELEARGWKGSRGTALAQQETTEAFTRESVLNRAETDGCWIVSIRVADKPAAMLICFRDGHTATTWKIAYDEDLARFSPGAQLMLEAAPILFSDPETRRLDSFAAANHPMIDHLWRGRLPVESLAVLSAGPALVTRAGVLADAAERRARAIVRNLRDRRRSRGTPSTGDDTP